ncbi:ABC transporter ATP-binding protein [Clostridia bacterium]|nr:ABC transporter ATP-binding protein [Clostridia bacterium]
MIKLTNLCKEYRDVESGMVSAGVDDVTLNVDTGLCYGLLGSNGAGKSTMLRVLTGIFMPTSGEVSVGGLAPYGNPEAKAQMFFINDETVQFHRWTLTELRDYYSFFYDSFDHAKWDKLQKAVDLPLGKKMAGFSKGMRRQAILITALASRPKYLFMDEAFDGIDPTMRIIVKKMLIDEMLDSGLTTVISSHNLKEINEFCDRAGLLHKGKLVFDRDLDSVKGDIIKVQAAFNTAETLTKETLAEKTGLAVLDYEKQGSLSYLILRNVAEEAREKLQILSPTLIDIIPLTLEEVFIYEMEVLGYDFKGSFTDEA